MPSTIEDVRVLDIITPLLIAGSRHPRRRALGGWSRTPDHDGPVGEAGGRIGYNPRVAGALDGILVADFSRVLAGPYATMLLGDLGATVVKVERPGVGDDTRTWGPPFAADGQSTYFQSVNRNKASIDLDLADEADRAIARRLADRADVLVENYKPGSLARFGLGYDDVAAVNPGVVYCSISGFGSDRGRASCRATTCSFRRWAG